MGDLYKSLFGDQLVGAQEPQMARNPGPNDAVRGMENPFSVARLLIGVAVFNVIGGIVAFFVVGSQSSSSVNLWPLATILLFGVLETAVMLWVASIFMDWLSVMYKRLFVMSDGDPREVAADAAENRNVPFARLHR
jgi:hypothetical protein